MNLDSTDLRILHQLQQDGRISNQELAEKVALSPSACLRRLRLLESEGIITGYRAVLNAERLGIEQSNTSRAIDFAVKRGFVTKTQSADDGRRLELTLTDLGASVIAELNTRRNEIHREMLSSWSDEEVRQLATLLDKLLTAYDDLA